jgi:hypothetical protein
MEYIKLDSDWLERQIKATHREVQSWPEEFREIVAPREPSNEVKHSSNPSAQDELTEHG